MNFNDTDIKPFIGFGIVSGAVSLIYNYRMCIFQTFIWGLFKLQAYYEIINKQNGDKKKSIWYIIKNNDCGEIIELENAGDIKTTYDFIIYGKYDNEYEIYNYKTHSFKHTNYMIGDIPLKFKQNSEYNSVNYKFLSVDVEYENESYVVKLNTHDSDYYFENNIVLSYSFIKWYLKIHYDIICDGDYKITILDNDVSILELDSQNNRDGILLEHDKYKVLN
tara:strand:+ start:80 stop:742 length:663 start_codon:yes stop_codon:yes gene_type:complete